MTHQYGKHGFPGTFNSRIKGGNWYRTSSGVINAASLGQNKMTLQPFWPAYRGTIDGLAYEMTVKAVSASGTDTMRFALYDDDGEGTPTGAPLFQTANLDLEGTPGNVGVQTTAVSWTGIEPKLYWLGCSRRNTGTIGTSPSLRLAANDANKVMTLGDSSATPVMGTTHWCNYEMTISADILPTIASLTKGTFIQTALILVKFT